MAQGPWTDLYALASVVHYAITGARADRPRSSASWTTRMRAARAARRGPLQRGLPARRSTRRWRCGRRTGRRTWRQFRALLDAGLPADSAGPLPRPRASPVASALPHDSGFAAARSSTTHGLASPSRGRARADAAAAGRDRLARAGLPTAAPAPPRWPMLSGTVALRSRVGGGAGAGTCCVRQGEPAPRRRAPPPAPLPVAERAAAGSAAARTAQRAPNPSLPPPVPAPVPAPPADGADRPPHRRCAASRRRRRAPPAAAAAAAAPPPTRACARRARGRRQHAAPTSTEAIPKTAGGCRAGAVIFCRKASLEPPHGRGGGLPEEGVPMNRVLVVRRAPCSLRCRRAARRRAAAPPHAATAAVEQPAAALRPGDRRRDRRAGRADADKLAGLPARKVGCQARQARASCSTRSLDAGTGQQTAATQQLDRAGRRAPDGRVRAVRGAALPRRQPGAGAVPADRHADARSDRRPTASTSR